MPAWSDPSRSRPAWGSLPSRSYARRFQSGGNLYDEGFLLTFADRVSRGAVVHRDFYSNYGPGGPWLLGGLFRLFGPHVWTERVLGGAARLLLAMALFAAGSRVGVAYGAAAFLICTVWGVVLGPAAYAWVLGVALVTAGVVLGASPGARQGRAWPAVAGLLVGLAALFRVELLAVGLVAATPALVQGRSRFGPARERAPFRLAWFGGLLAGLLPLAVHVAVAGPRVVFDNLVIYPVLLAGPARHLPIPPTEPRALAFFLMATGAAAAAAVVAFLALRRRFENPSDLVVASVALLSLALSPEVLQRLDIDHLSLVAMVSVSALPIYVGYRYASSAAWHPGRRSLTAVCALLVLPVVFAGVRVAPAYEVRSHGREFYFASAAMADATRAAIADLDRLGRPGRRLIVAPADLYRSPLDDADIYWLLPQLDPGTYFIQFDPGVTNRAGSDLDREIAASSLLVLTQYDADFPDSYVPSNPAGAAPSAAVRANFCEVAQHPPYTILSRCSH